MTDLASMSTEDLIKLKESLSSSKKQNDLNSLSTKELLEIKKKLSSSTRPSVVIQDDQPYELDKAIPAFLSGAGRGVLNLGQNINQLESKGVDALLGTKFQGAAPRVSMPQGAESLMSQYPGTANVGQLVGEAAPLAFMPEAWGGEIASAAPYISRLPKALQGSAKLGGRVAKGSAVGAGINPIYQPGVNLSDSMQEGALSGGAGSMLGPLAGATRRGAGSLITMGGTKTPEEIKRVLDASDVLGIKLPLGETIGSRGVLNAQKVIKNVPGSGMSQEYTNIASGIEDQMNNLATKLNPDNVHAGESTKESLSNKREQLGSSVSDIYSSLKNNIDKYAPGRIHTNNNLIEESKNISNEISKNRRLAGSDIKVPTDVKSFLKGTRWQYLTLKEALSQDEIINDWIAEASRKVSNGEKGGKKELSFFNRLKSANLKDIDSTVDRIGQPELVDQWKQAKSFYKENIVPFDKKGSILGKIISDKTRPDDVLSLFLKTSGQQPKSQILNEVSSQLPQDIKDQIMHNYLMGPGEQDSLNMVDKYEKLQPRQRNLLSPEDKQKMDAASILKKHVGKTEMNQMFIPETGAKNAAFQVPLAMAGTGYAVGGPIGAIASLAGGTAASRGLKELLMSDFMKNLYQKGLKQSQASSPELGRSAYLGLPLNSNNGNR